MVGKCVERGEDPRFPDESISSHSSQQSGGNVSFSILFPVWILLYEGNEAPNLASKQQGDRTTKPSQAERGSPNRMTDRVLPRTSPSLITHHETYNSRLVHKKAQKQTCLLELEKSFINMSI